MDGLMYAFLFIAVAIGFVFGRLSKKTTSALGSIKNTFRGRYLESLNQLLKQEPDVAIESFVENLPVNNETLETHLALGSLLRKRGEVDRAIRIHQNLIARPNLSLRQMEYAQLELALDYKQSGLLDRAESLFNDISGSSNYAVKHLCYENLVELYQIEQEWLKAINTAELLCNKKNKKQSDKWRRLQAHFCCELADKAWKQDAFEECNKWTEKALVHCKQFPRACLLKVKIALRHNTPKEALHWLEQVKIQSDYFNSFLPLAEACFKQLGAPQKHLRFLKETYLTQPSFQLLLPIADSIYEERGAKTAILFLQEELNKEPQLALLSRTLEVIDLNSLEYVHLKNVVEEFLPPAFQCRHCGFQGIGQYWCCPTCNTWL